MSFSRKTLAIVAFVVVSFTATAWIVNWKSGLLGPQVAKCPAAFNDAMTLLSSFELNEDFVQNIWDCTVGGLLYLAIPGLGLGWIVAKWVSD